MKRVITAIIATIALGLIGAQAAQAYIPDARMKAAAAPYALMDMRTSLTLNKGKYVRAQSASMQCSSLGNIGTCKATWYLKPNIFKTMTWRKCTGTYRVRQVPVGAHGVYVYRNDGFACPVYNPGT